MLYKKTKITHPRYHQNNEELVESLILIRLSNTYSVFYKIYTQSLLVVFFLTVTNLFVTIQTLKQMNELIITRITFVALTFKVIQNSFLCQWFRRTPQYQSHTFIYTNFFPHKNLILSWFKQITMTLSCAVVYDSRYLHIGLSILNG